MGSVDVIGGYLVRPARGLRGRFKGRLCFRFDTLDMRPVAGDPLITNK